MCGGHCDDECKEVVDEGVECLVHESAPEEEKQKIKTVQSATDEIVPGEVSNRLQLVVEEELRQHEEEPKGINPIHSGLQEKSQLQL